MILPDPLHLPPGAARNVDKPSGRMLVAVLCVNGFTLAEAYGPAGEMHRSDHAWKSGASRSGFRRRSIPPRGEMRIKSKSAPASRFNRRSRLRLNAAVTPADRCRPAAVFAGSFAGRRPSRNHASAPSESRAARESASPRRDRDCRLWSRGRTPCAAHRAAAEQRLHEVRDDRHDVRQDAIAGRRSA